MDEIFIGVVIPYYRTSIIREVLMKELIQNLRSQIQFWNYFKICIYEDGSNSKWLDEIDDENIKVLRGCENKGISFARNRAMEYLLDIGCDYLVFVDSDDYLDYNYLYKILVEIIKNPRMYYFTDFDILGNISPRCGLRERITGVVLHKSILENARFDENIRIAEDVDFGNKYLRDKLIEPYYIDTTYHYNFGIDKKCLSYQLGKEK